jgi:hypothetical protein
MLSDLIDGEGSFNIRELRQPARNFTPAELDKELIVHRHIQQWMPQVNAVLEKLALSQRNQKMRAARDERDYLFYFQRSQLLTQER